MSRLFSVFFTIVTLFLVSGCVYQVSSLQSYNGSRYESENQCQVYRTSLEPKFYEIVQHYNEFILGDSHVSTGGTYENIEAAYDCMTIGAKSAVVLDRGVVSSSTSYVPGTTTYHYNPYSNTYNSFTTSGYFVSNSTSAYVVVFLGKTIPKIGHIYTRDAYKEWKRANGIASCSGC